MAIVKVMVKSRLATLVLFVTVGLCHVGAPRHLHGQRPDTAQLAGVVVSSDTKAPISMAVVTIPAMGLTARTDDKGRFVFRGLPTGRFIIRVTGLGYSALTQSVSVEVGDELTLALTLVPKVVTLPTLEVLRDRTEIGRHAEGIPGAVHVVALEQVANHSRVYDDVHSVLRQIPGVNTTDEDGYGLRPNIGMRGTGSERSSKITLMEDGVLIAPAPYAAPAAYYFPVLGRMSAVEVRKGSSQIKYGPRTVGGALNLVSMPIPDTFRLNGEVAGGEDLTRKFNARIGDAYGNVGWLVGMYRLASRGFKQIDTGGDTGFDIQDYDVKLRINNDYSAPTHHTLEIRAGLYDERSRETYLGLTDADFATDPLRRYAASQLDVMTAQQRRVQLRHLVQWNRGIDLTTTIYRNEFSRNWFKLQSVRGQSIATVLNDPTGFADDLATLRGRDSEPDALSVRANNRTYFSQGVQSVLGLQFIGADMLHQIELGVRYHEDQEDRFQHEDAFQMVAAEMVLTAKGAPGSQSNQVNAARAVAVFLEDQISFGAFSVTPGLRYETIAFDRTTYPSDDPTRLAPANVQGHSVEVLIPGVGVSYEWRRGASVFGGVHRGFAPPGPGASEQTEAERSVNYEVGGRYQTRKLRVQLVGFFNDYGNMLGVSTLATGETGSGELFNGGEVNVFGFELSANYDPLSQWRAIHLPVSVSLTYTSATFTTSFQSAFEPWGTVTAGDKLPYLPALQFYGAVGITSPEWRVMFGANYQSSMRTVAGRGSISQSQKADAFLNLSVSGEYAFTPWTSAFVAIQNLTNEHHVAARRPAGARPRLPRRVVAGLRFHL